MNTEFVGSGARVVPFSSISMRRWGADSLAHDLIDSPARRLTYEHMPSGETETTHRHRRAHQVFHVIAGTLHIEVEGEILQARERDTIEVPPGAAHRAFTDDEAATFIVFATPSTNGDRHDIGVAASSTNRTRFAVDNDVDEIVRLRRLMFEEMGLDTSSDGWEEVARDVIRREMAGDRMVAVVIDSPTGAGDLVASGIVQFDIGLPGPGIESSGRAYISSMSTDRDWRGRGFAGEILTALLGECDRRGVTVIGLHATPQGRSIYERHGFQPRGGNPEMRLVRRGE
jgi:mannose-6-phosphate isomerase-like protein (cupin superfamily)/GNAT superfamily N-acetyltransferase